MIHIISQLVLARILYFAFVEDLLIVVCFLIFQETKESPRNKQKPINDLLLNLHTAQSESHDSEIRSEELAG